MADAVKEVKAILTSQDNMSPGMKTAAASALALQKAAGATSPSFLSMSSAMAAGTLAAGLVTKGVTAAAGAIAGTIKAAGTYEQSMNVFQAVSRASDDQMQAVRSTAVALGKDLTLPATSSADAGRAMTELAKSGLSVDQAMAAAKGTLQLAAAAGIEEANAAKITGAALNAFGLEGSNATRIADMLATASNISAAEIVDLGAGLQQAGFAFKATGRPVEELVGSLALLTNAGLTGSDAGTALKNAIIRMVDPTKEAKKVMTEYGISLFDAQGNLKSMPDIVDNLNKGLSGLTPEARNSALSTMFLSDGWKALQPLLDQGGDKLRSVITELGRAGSAAELAGARTKGTIGAWDGLKSVWETLEQSLGTKLSPALESMIRAVTAFVDAIGDEAEKLDLTPLAANLQSFGTDVSNAIYSAGQAVAEFSSNVGSTIPGIGPVFDSAGNAVGSALIGLAAILRGDVQGATAAFGESWRQLSQGTFPEAATALQNLSRAAEENQKVLAGIALGFATFAGAAAAAAAIGGITASLTGLATSAAALPALIQGIAAAIGGLATGAILVLPTVFAATALAWITDFGNIRTNTEATVASIDGALRTVPSIVQTAFESAVSAATTAWADLQSATSASMAAIGAEVAAGWEAYLTEPTRAAVADLETVVAEGWGLLTTSISGQFAAIVAAVTEGWGSSNAETSVAMASMNAAIDEGWAAAVAATSGAMASMAGAISEASGQMVAAISGAMSQVVATISSFAGETYSAALMLGQNAVQGIRDGINAGIQAVAGAAAALVRSAISAARQEADAQSPSRKMVALGEDMWAGLNNALAAGTIDDGILAQIRDYAGAIQDQLPYLGEIARVEREIKDIREDASVDAMFRAVEMINAESDLLNLKRDMAQAEYDLIPARQAAANAAREAQSIERGTLEDRQRLISIDGQQAQLRLQELAIREQLIGLSAKDKRAVQLQAELDVLRQQHEALQIQGDRITTVNKIQANNAKIAAEAYKTQVDGAEAAQQGTKNQIEVLTALEAVFKANEAVIKNATDNEVGYRERLIAVFKSESTPLQDRIAAGLQLVNQLESEGRISKQLADQLRGLSGATNQSAGLTGVHGNVAAAVSTQIRALGMVTQSTSTAFVAQARAVDKATDELEAYNKAASKAGVKMKLDVRNTERINVETGTGGAPSFDYNNFSPADYGGSALASGGPVQAGVPYWVGETGPEPFVPTLPGRVVDNASAMRSLGGGGGKSVTYAPTIIVEGSVVTEEKLIRTVTDGLRRFSRDNAGDLGF